MMKKRELENICKGVANHRRIEILTLLADEPGLTVVDIAEKTGAGLKTISVHLQRMHRSGLIFKTSRGAFVCHNLSPRGKHILKFLRMLE